MSSENLENGEIIATHEEVNRRVSQKSEIFTAEDNPETDPNDSRDDSSEASRLAHELDQRSIYVANVDYSATPQQLESLFLQVGTVQKVTILVHRYTGFPKGYAYVAFQEKESVSKAIEKFNDHLLRGRPLKVYEKKTIKYDRVDRAGHGGRGSGRGRSRGRGRGRGRGKGRGQGSINVVVAGESGGINQ
ncbi:hypothetical protein OXX79_002621 [Metschnikowia pulcherrima]